MTHTHTINSTTIARRLVAGFAIAAAALMVLPAASFATKFGAGLEKGLQPSNGAPAHPCFMGNPGSCTRVSLDAYNAVGHEQAPKDGVIGKLKVIAATPGSFKFQLAEAKPNKEKAKVVHTGPKIEYDSSGNQYKVQSFNVHVPVDKGDYLATKSKKSSMLRCSSGGANQLLFQPALSVGDPFQNADDTDGCWLLLQAVYT